MITIPDTFNFSFTENIPQSLSFSLSTPLLFIICIMSTECQVKVEMWLISSTVIEVEQWIWYACEFIAYMQILFFLFMLEQS